ncbi:MAG: hypothetical protein ACOYL6_10600 [Bacteriovoracaceae bacterium]
MEKKDKLQLDEMLSDSEMIDKTLNNMKISNEDVLKSDTNVNIQAVFNSVLGTPEPDMSDDNKLSNSLDSMDDDEGKATVVLDINAMKAELESNSGEAEIDLSFGDDGGDEAMSLGSLDSSPLEMDSLDSTNANDENSDMGGMDIDLSMGDMELTGTETGSSENESSSAPGMEMDGLDLSTELGALESSSGELVEEEEPLILNSDNNDEVIARETAGLTGDLDSAFSEPSSMLSMDQGEELEVSPPDASLDDLDFSSMPDLPSIDDKEVQFNEKPAAVATKSEVTRTDILMPEANKAPLKSEVLSEVTTPNFQMGDLEAEDMFAPPEIEAQVEEAPPVVVKVAEPRREAAPARPQAREVVKHNPQTHNDRDYATHQDYVAHHDDELMRLSSTIRGLRDDRQQLLDKINKLEEEKKYTQQDNITMKAELDEKKIEVSLIKKRHNDDLNHLRYQLNLTEDKRVMLEEKNRLLRQEFDKLASKVRVDFNKIQAREKELENQLELLKSDSEVQIRNRDSKIMDLKRKIDTLEFDMENIVIKENQSRNLQGELESKLDKTIKTLRNAINSLESEDDNLQKFELLKKKNLDL